MLTICQELTNYFTCILSLNPQNSIMRDSIIFPISQITEVIKALDELSNLLKVMQLVKQQELAYTQLREHRLWNWTDPLHAPYPYNSPL